MFSYKLSKQSLRRGLNVNTLFMKRKPRVVIVGERGKGDKGRCHVYWLVLTVNCKETQRVTQQVRSLLWKGCKEEPYLWVVQEEAEVFYLLNSLSSPISHWPNFSPWRAASLHLGLCLLTPSIPSERLTPPPHSAASSKATVMVRGALVRSQLKQELMGMWGGAQCLCPSADSHRIECSAVHLSPTSDLDLLVQSFRVSMTFTHPAGNFPNHLTQELTEYTAHGPNPASGLFL